MSLMSREDMLRELELLPVWQLRQPLPMPLKIEPAAADHSEVIAEQVFIGSSVKEQDLPVANLPVIESAVVESAEPESSMPEPTLSVPPVLEAPGFEVPVFQLQVPQPIEATENFEIAPVQEPVLEPALSLPLRLLLSEDSCYAFLIEPYATEGDVEQSETLLKNMIRAMQASCRVEVTDSADKIFAAHTPKLIICLGAEAANRLSGKTLVIDEWRNIQQEMPPHYEQIPLIVTYHPAHLLANTADKALAWRDLCVAMKLIQRL